MSIYFQEFPITKYDLYFNKQLSDVTDIFRIVKVKNRFKDDITFYNFYDIQDGERPDVVSQKLYGSPEYYWTFFMINDSLVNYYADWPLSNTDLQVMIDKKYEGTVLTTSEDFSTKFIRNTAIQGLKSGARANVISKDSNNGTIYIEPISGVFLPNEIVRDELTNDFITIDGLREFKYAIHHYEDANGNYVNKSISATPITNEEYEFNLNDAKAKIKTIRPAYIRSIADQFIEQINSGA
jgi:hypothetical protein